ncbi:MAG: hypothetical protein GF411_11870 [Candidatus Lokiarchaeota archaeon]|nr:hypothetical protein [Candidatus Lokiarchaeota archaeon]
MQYNDQIIGLEGEHIQAARIISRLTPAPLINLYVGIIIAYTSPIGLGPILDPSGSIIICLVFMVILPVSPIIFSAMRGSTDLDVSERVNRHGFFIFAILCYVLSYVVYAIFQCDVMRILSAAYITVTTGVLLSNTISKISVHGAGVGGPGTALIFYYGLIALPVIVLWILVVWSRVKLKQHSLPQAIGGVALGMIITTATYVTLYVPIVHL